MRLSDLIKDEYKTKKKVENEKLNEGLLGIILAPLAIYYVSQWLANILENIADYMDGHNSKLIAAQKKIVDTVGSDSIRNKINAAYAKGASSERLAQIYVSHPETQAEIKKFKNDKRVQEAGGLQALEDELKKTMTKAYADDELQRKSVKDMEKKLK
jgi:hypothetical protein